jgi:hypothetical protein
MAFPLVAALLGGATIGKHFMARDAANRDRKLQSETARYRPWTGLTPQATQDPNLFADLLQGGATAAMMGGFDGSSVAAESAGFAPSQSIANANLSAGNGGLPGLQGGMPLENSSWAGLSPVRQVAASPALGGGKQLFGRSWAQLGGFRG